MKKLILIEIAKRIQSKPNLKRKLKIFAVVGVFGFIVTTGLVIWAGVSAVRFASNEIQLVNVQGELENIKSRWQSLPRIAMVSCWDKAQSLMNYESWATRPVVDNFKNLKIACLEVKPICEGDSCHEMKKRMNSAEWEQTI